MRSRTSDPIEFLQKEQWNDVALDKQLAACRRLHFDISKRRTVLCNRKNAEHGRQRCIQRSQEEGLADKLPSSST